MDYHQKSRLRSHRDVFAQFRPLLPDERAFTDSTAAARLNGWLDGFGSSEQLERELPLTGLSEAMQDEVRAFAGRRARVSRPVC